MFFDNIIGTSDETSSNSNTSKNDNDNDKKEYYLFLRFLLKSTESGAMGELWCSIFSTILKNSALGRLLIYRGVRGD